MWGHLYKLGCLLFLAKVALACYNAPYFDPLEPFTATFYRGVESTYHIVARDDDASDQVTVISSLLPTSGSFFKDVDATPDGDNPVYYALRWTPLPEDIDMTACFQATDSVGIRNVNGNYCINMVIGTSDIIYFTGTVRDFKSTHADFGHTSENMDDDFLWVDEYLDSEGNPVFKTTNGVPTSTSESGFSEWWNDVDGVNYPFTYTITLSNVTLEDSRIYTFSTSEFYPIDGEHWPGETVEETAEDEAHNYLFTYEVHGYMEFNGDETLHFQSSDDLWVFINGRLPEAWSLGGIHEMREHVVTLDASTAAYFGLSEVNPITLSLSLPLFLYYVLFICNIIYCIVYRVNYFVLNFSLPIAIWVLIIT